MDGLQITQSFNVLTKFIEYSQIAVLLVAESIFSLPTYGINQINLICAYKKTKAFPLSYLNSINLTKKFTSKKSKLIPNDTHSARNCQFESKRPTYF
jgi:ABC-type branched-subunit amino acid transport system ATPase component